MFVCHTVLSVPCSLVVTCWEKTDLLALVYVMFSCVFATFPYGVLGQVWYLIVSIPDLCFLFFILIYFKIRCKCVEETHITHTMVISFASFSM